MPKKLFFVILVFFLSVSVCVLSPQHVFAKGGDTKAQAIQTTADQVQNRFASYQEKLQSWIDQTDTQLNQQEKEAQTTTPDQSQPLWQKWLHLKKLQKILFGRKQRTPKQDEKVRTKLQTAKADLSKANDLGKDAVAQLRLVGDNEATASAKDSQQIKTQLQSAKDEIRRAQTAYIQVTHDVRNVSQAMR